MRILSIFTTLVLLASCSGDDSPVTPSPQRWQLTGTVTRSGGAGLAGAVLDIRDGANAGQSVATDGTGRYTFSSLEQGSFTVRAQAVDHDAVLSVVSLTGNTVLDFALSKTLHAVLAPEGEAVGEVQRDGTFAASFTGVNTGDGCAGSISGVTDFLAIKDGPPVLSRTWSVPPTAIVRPGERFQYRVCCLAAKDAYANAFYRTHFSFLTVPCP